MNHFAVVFTFCQFVIAHLANISYKQLDLPSGFNLPLKWEWRFGPDTRKSFLQQFSRKSNQVYNLKPPWFWNELYRILRANWQYRHAGSRLQAELLFQDTRQHVSVVSQTPDALFYYTCAINLWGSWRWSHVVGWWVVLCESIFGRVLRGVSIEVDDAKKWMQKYFGITFRMMVHAFLKI